MGIPGASIKKKMNRLAEAFLDAAYATALSALSSSFAFLLPSFLPAFLLCIRISFLLSC